MNHKLTIRFAGICTHFRFGVAAGVPHRVVLADTSRFTTDLVTVDESLVEAPVLYYLMPHFAQLEVEGGKVPLNLPPFDGKSGMAIKDGDIVSGIRLQVINAIDRGLVYADDDTPKIAEYVPNYNFSTDVVLHGRAMCYFDLYGGNVYSREVKGGARQTFVEMTTDGPPQLLVTPLASSSTPIIPALLSLGDAAETMLDVKNLEAADGERELAYQRGAFDFLLHYLTATGGVPGVIKKLTPGLAHHNLVSATQEDLARALQGMATILRGPRVLVRPEEATPSCSDSLYP